MRLLIIADDAPMARAVRQMLRYAPSCRVVGWMDAHRPSEGVMTAARADIVVLAAKEESSLARGRDARAELPQAKVVLLAERMDAGLLAGAAAAGIDAAVAKSASPASIATLIREIAEGNVVNLASPPSPPRQAEAPKCSLTPRELEILRHVAAGWANSRIAAELWVAEQTVKFHLSNIYRKLGLANRTEAANYAHVNGLVEPPAAAPPARTAAPPERTAALSVAA